MVTILSFFTVSPSPQSMTSALRSCINTNSFSISASVTTTSGTDTVKPSVFVISTFGSTSYTTANTKSESSLKSGVPSSSGCEYDNGREYLSADSNASSNTFCITSSYVSARNVSPNFCSRIFTGTLPLRKPGIWSCFAYFFVKSAYRFCTSSCLTVIESFIRDFSIGVNSFVKFIGISLWY